MTTAIQPARFVTPDELADMLQLKRTTIMAKVVRQPGFPASVTGQQKPRWLRSEVDKFFRRQSAQNAQPA